MDDLIRWRWLIPVSMTTVIWIVVALLAVLAAIDPEARRGSLIVAGISIVLWAVTLKWMIGYVADWDGDA